MTGIIFETQAILETTAVVSNKLLSSQVTFEPSTYGMYTSRLTASAIEPSTIGLFLIEATVLCLEISFVAFGSTSILPGTIIPPSGTTNDHLSPTEICCDGLWNDTIPLCPEWVGSTSSVNIWTTKDC